MKKLCRALLLGIAYLACTQANAIDAAIDAAMQAKINAKLDEIHGWAVDASIVNAVKAQNTTKPAVMSAMTEEKWKAPPVALGPFIRTLSTNSAAEFLKSKRGNVVTEAFVSDADGCKVAFLAKSSSWSHKGKPKHEVPMGGKSWQGAFEVDQSTGMRQMQIAVPVLDGGKPIGSLVVGLSVDQLGR